MLAALCSVSILIPVVEVQKSHRPDQPCHWHVLIMLSLTETLSPYHSPSQTLKQAFSPQKQVHVSNENKSLVCEAAEEPGCSYIPSCSSSVTQCWLVAWTRR